MFGQDKSEIALIRACQQGDTRAFEAIVCKYQSLVCAITYSGTDFQRCVSFISIHKKQRL